MLPLALSRQHPALPTALPGCPAAPCWVTRSASPQSWQHLPLPGQRPAYRMPCAPELTPAAACSIKALCISTAQTAPVTTSFYTVPTYHKLKGSCTHKGR